MTSAIPNFDSLILTYKEGDEGWDCHEGLTHRGNLYVGNGDVEKIVHICVPNYSDVGYDHCPKVPLITETKIYISEHISGFTVHLERFQTPLTVDTISSTGRSFRFLLSRIAPRNFSSRYILLELKALNSHDSKVIKCVLCPLYSLVNPDDRGEEPGAAWEEVGEDELEPGVVALGEEVEGLRHPPQLGVDSLGGDVEDTAVAHG